MKINEVLNIINEMGFEIGQRKDGTYGYRSVINGNMSDQTPPANKQFVDAVMLVLDEKNYLPKLKKFDLETVDIIAMPNGGAQINFEDGSKVKLKPEEISSKMKGK